MLAKKVHQDVHEPSHNLAFHRLPLLKEHSPFEKNYDLSFILIFD